MLINYILIYLVIGWLLAINADKRCDYLCTKKELLLITIFWMILVAYYLLMEVED